MGPASIRAPFFKKGALRSAKSPFGAALIVPGAPGYRSPGEKGWGKRGAQNPSGRPPFARGPPLGTGVVRAGGWFGGPPGPLFWRSNQLGPLFGHRWGELREGGGVAWGTGPGQTPGVFRRRKRGPLPISPFSALLRWPGCRPSASPGFFGGGENLSPGWGPVRPTPFWEKGAPFLPPLKTRKRRGKGELGKGPGPPPPAGK